MKKLIFIKLLVLTLFVITACSKEDSSGDLLSSVPSGEIVPVEQREAVLIGYSTGQKTQGGQKWWLHEVTEITYDCAGYDESDNETSTVENGYFAFKENGTIYYKIGMNGTESAHHDWEWASSAKEAIIVQGVSFKFTELNANTVTYASVQGEDGCQLLTWEKFTH